MKIADKDLIDRALAGSDGARVELLECLEALIRSSIRRYYYRPNEFEDLAQEARIKILECLEEYDPSKGVHFLGYVKSSLRFLFLSMKDYPCLSLDYESEGRGCLVDLLVSHEDLEAGVIGREEISILRKALGTLTDLERDSVILFYIENKSIGEIAQSRGRSYRTIVNNKSRAMSKLKKYLDGKI